MKAGDLIFSRVNEGLSAIIRWWTISEWSHVSVVIDSAGTFIEATWPSVRRGHVLEITGAYAYASLKQPLTLKEQEAFLRYLKGRIGRKYDLAGLFSFLLRRNVQKKNYFFCSELAVEAFAAAGRQVIRKESAWTSPQDLYESVAFDITDFRKDPPPPACDGDVLGSPVTSNHDSRAEGASVQSPISASAGCLISRPKGAKP